MKNSLLVVACLLICTQSAASTTYFSDLSLDGLFQIRLAGASKCEQKQSEVVADISLSNHNEINPFGWRTLNGALVRPSEINARYDNQYRFVDTRGFIILGDFNT